MAESKPDSDLWFFAHSVSDRSGSAPVSRVRFCGLRVGRVLVAFILFVFVTGHIVETLICPRCGKRFASTWWYHRGMLFAN
jgi:hypothetical protein